MKIAIFHELNSGGALRTVEEVNRHLKKIHTVDLYTTTNSFLPKKWQGQNWRIKLYKDTFELLKLYNLHKKLAKEIDRERYEIIFVHPSQYTQAPFILRFLKTKIFYYSQEPLRMVYETDLKLSVNSLSPLKKYYEITMRFLRKKIDRDNIAQSDIILTNSRFTQRNIESAYGLKSIVSYLGVDERLFSPQKMQKKYDILYIGSRNEIDGYPLLMQCLSVMRNKPKVKCHITDEDWLDDENSFRKLYLQSKIVLCLSKNEPFGLIPLEAMACGMAVIAVDEGGYRETVIDGSTGFLVRRDPKDIAEKITFLLMNDKERELMGENAREHILRNWTWDKSIKRLNDYFALF